MSIRKQLGLGQGHHLDLSVEDGGAIVLRPVAIYPTVRLNDRGLDKLREARESGTAAMPDWMTREMEDAGFVQASPVTSPLPAPKHPQPEMRPVPQADRPPNRFLESEFQGTAEIDRRGRAWANRFVIVLLCPKRMIFPPKNGIV